MLTILSAMVSLVSFRFRRRASLELEVLALRHQVAVLHRQRTGRARLGPGDRLLWAWLYRAWPRCLKVMVLVKPATVIQWHRQGFRRYWRWRSCSRRVGRPGVNREIRDLIRQMSVANSLWGAPRIHGEMLKLGIEVSQATVERHMVRRHGSPSPTWRAFLCNQVDGIAAIDMFVVVTAAFRLLYVGVILSHARRKILAPECPPSIRPQVGSPARSQRRFRGAPRHATCCETATHRMARTSAAGSKRWA